MLEFMRAADCPRSGEPIALPDRPITYSPAYTVVPTYECFNRCTYCNFRVDPGDDAWISLDAVRSRLLWARAQGAIEVLILSGEVHPRSARRAAWVDHLERVAQVAIALDLLPHTNAGPLTPEEMARLAAVNVSMGLMVEQVTPQLLETVHRHAPSKEPALRLAQLDQAGRLGIPFTTGLLVGIGETDADCADTLRAIAQTHDRHGHIQEVIVQPHSAGQRQRDRGATCDPQRLLNIVTLARSLLPAEIAIQIPPNLAADPATLRAAIAAGATDLGGIGPLDEVNPDYAHPTPAQLAAAIAPVPLVRRLPVYPQYDAWVPDALQCLVTRWRSRLAQRSAHRDLGSSSPVPESCQP
jgi:FO synthase subunit 1